MPTEAIHLPAPLRDVKLVRSRDRAVARQEELQEAVERGRIEGERALAAQLVQQRADVLELQTGVLAALRDAVPQVARDCERALVALALEVARKLVAGMPVSAEMVEAAVREACAEVEDHSELSVQLHPEDLALLERIHSPLLLPQGGQEKIRFEGTPHVSRGGCVVKTRFGLIDARRETKLEQLQKAVTA